MKMHIRVYFSLSIIFLIINFHKTWGEIPSLKEFEENSFKKENDHLKQKNLDLNTAVYRTLRKSLNLHISSDIAQSRRYQVKQARLAPNPEFSYTVQNFAGNNDWKGWHNREESYIYSQLFETAGKRLLRTQAAIYQYYASIVGYDVSKLIILNRLNRAFINVAAAQELLQLTLDQAEIAKEILRIATKKVEVGKVSLIQQDKAQVAYSTALIAVDRAKVEFKNSKRRLSLVWSEACPDFNRVIFPFYETIAPISLEQCLADLCNQSEVVQSFYQYLNNKKIWRLEKANSIPNVTLQIGYRSDYNLDSQGNNKQGLIASVSVPIPIFNRNQGNIGSAYFDMLKTGDQGKQLWLLLQSKLAISHEDLERAYRESERIKNISLPAATQAFNLAEKGYREGKFEYLDVLDAQRTLFDVRERYIQSLVNYHTRQSDINYLNSQTE